MLTTDNKKAASRWKRIIWWEMVTCSLLAILSPPPSHQGCVYLNIQGTRRSEFWVIKNRGSQQSEMILSEF